MGFMNVTQEDILFQQKWFEENWKLSFYPVGAYVLFLVVGTNLMRDRKPFGLSTASGSSSFHGLKYLNSLTPSLLSSENRSLFYFIGIIIL